LADELRHELLALLDEGLGARDRLQREDDLAGEALQRVVELARQRRVALEDELAEAVILQRERERRLQSILDGGAGGREDDALGAGAEEEARTDVARLADERDGGFDGGG